MNNYIEERLELKVPISKVWKAISDYQEFGDWFRVRVEAPFVPGRSARGKLTYPGYEDSPWQITVKEMKPESLFSFTWHPYAVDPAKDYSHEIPTLVEFRLEKIPLGTVLLLKESGFDKIPKERQLEAFRMNSKGWAEQMKNIKAHVLKKS